MSTPIDERRVEYMPLSSIRRAPRNPKRHDALAIRASMGRFGVADLPVLDERTGQLVSGHGRLDQAWALSQMPTDQLTEYTPDGGPPRGVKVDPNTGEWLLPVVRGWASSTDEEAEAYLVTANSLTMFGGWDEQALTELLSDLAEVDADLLTLTGYSTDELARLLDTVGTAGQTGRAAEPPEDFPEYDEATIATEHQCPACGYQWSGGKAVAAATGDG